MRFLSWVLAALMLAVPAMAERRQTSAGPVEVTRMVGGLDTPWSLAFLPGGAVLVTERGGRLLFVSGGTARPVTGVPAVRAEGQGGLLDVAAARDFGASREIFLTYAAPSAGGGATALGVARLSDDGARLEGFREIFRQDGPGKADHHYGGRVVEARDGTLFLTVGDRGDEPAVQDPGTHKGKIIRVRRDGSAPADNPFVDVPGARPEVWSLGHRNDQGAALGQDGVLWTVMHGARGGDEVNRPAKGKNYGWPVISFGMKYSGEPIGEGTAKPGMEQPLHYWDPSIAPSGLLVYSGKLWPEWRGDLFTGSLKFDMIVRLSPNGAGVAERERLFEGVYPRIRDVREAPDGSIWFISETDGAIFRMTPSGPAN